MLHESLRHRNHRWACMTFNMKLLNSLLLHPLSRSRASGPLPPARCGVCNSLSRIINTNISLIIGKHSGITMNTTILRTATRITTTIPDKLGTRISTGDIKEKEVMSRIILLDKLDVRLA